ncbi:hypothetical protein [Erythrobacter donghaensis]|uniref:hypothetical protein n=1 Tax=Erythrobacter donghaensis TaxID=267135 RepID=UPI001B803B07|nr:hypothetical protein [Erythrobacter donghaensis]
MPRLPIIAAPLLLLALAACGGERASAPGGVSPGEAKALEDAASMLDARQLPPEALPTDVPPPSAPATAAPAAELTGDAAAARP